MEWLPIKGHFIILKVGREYMEWLPIKGPFIILKVGREYMEWLPIKGHFIILKMRVSFFSYFVKWWSIKIVRWLKRNKVTGNAMSRVGLVYV